MRGSDAINNVRNWVANTARRAEERVRPATHYSSAIYEKVAPERNPKNEVHMLGIFEMGSAAARPTPHMI